MLILDEAQDMSDDLLEEVRLLSNLETEDRKLLQIVLVGQPELRKQLEADRLRQLRQRITVRYPPRPHQPVRDRGLHPPSTQDRGFQGSARPSARPPCARSTVTRAVFPG